MWSDIYLLRNKIDKFREYMIQDLYVKIYNAIPDAHGRRSIYSPMNVLVRILANLHIPFFFKTIRKHQYKGVVKKDLYVSLTSFPARIDRLWIVIESILHQTVRPERILLWLSKEQFHNIGEIPDSLLKLEQYGLEIILVEDDYRSHKKYLYVCRDYPDKYVVLIDDDICYPSNHIEKLLNAYESQMDKNIIVAAYGSNMVFDNNGKLEPYYMWVDNTDNSISNCHFFGSGGGVLFVPSTLYKDVTNIQLAMKLTPTADDIWLNAMVRLAGQSVLMMKSSKILPVLSAHNTNLSFANIYENRNDIQIEAVNDYYQKTIGKVPFDMYNI